ncbi:MAG TPA: M24 family metallopeptidase [Thermoanaerobaculia bacterium]|nr:M24 family metallopeptidase [Thermoanaerobaculia bacterium]
MRPLVLAGVRGGTAVNAAARIALCAAIVLVSSLHAAEPQQGRSIKEVGSILSERARVEAVNSMLRDRLDNLLPQLMRETGIDLWLIINREYAEDPVYLTLVPEPVFAARRTTILLIHDRGPEKGVERLTVSRYPMSGFYSAAWEGGNVEEQWTRLGELLRERNPRKIGINTSRHWAFGDGLTHALHEELMRVLDPSLRSRVTSAEQLAVRWLETRTARELEVYPRIVAIARAVISEAFSDRVITPGVTTTDDVAWYIRQRYSDLNLPIWFMPYVNIQRPGEKCDAETAFCGTSGVIRPGDVLHTDVGITYLRLNTDTQEMGYVLRADETDVPSGLKNAMAAGNRWQDLLTREFVTGRTGNAILAATRAASSAEKILSTTYTHPLGFFGHAAGPTIGMWDNQGPTPVHGDWTLRPNTAYAIEGNVKVPVPEWDGQLVQIKLEQSAVFDGKKVTYLAGRQTRWHVVR